LGFRAKEGVAKGHTIVISKPRQGYDWVIASQLRHLQNGSQLEIFKKRKEIKRFPEMKTDWVWKTLWLAIKGIRAFFWKSKWTSSRKLHRKKGFSGTSNHQ